MDLASRIQESKSLVDKLLGERDALNRQILQTRDRIAVLQQEVDVLGYVSGLFRHLIDSEIVQAVKSVAALQTDGLQEIFFDQDISVVPEITETRGKIAVRFLIRHTSGKKVVEGDSLDSFGGSILTIQSILLRITVLFRRGLRPLLLLDETLSAVADRYVDRAIKFLSSLSDSLGLDILLVTHDDAIVSMAHHAYMVVRKGDEAVFQPLDVATKKPVRRARK